MSSGTYEPTCSYGDPSFQICAGTDGADDFYKECKYNSGRNANTNFSLIPVRHVPVGFADGFNAQETEIFGWAVDRDEPTAQIQVHVYRGAPAGQGGVFVGAVTANQARAGLSYPGNHGFTFSIPVSLHRQVHSYYVYAISADTTLNAQLSNSPLRSTGSLFGVAHPIIVGTDKGIPGVIRGFNADNSQLVFESRPYGNFTGGIRVATADVNGDGTLDVIAAPGAGGGPHVRIYSGVDGSTIRSFFAYDQSFSQGLFVAAADFDGDGKAEVVTGADAGGGPHVRIWSGADNHEIRSFFAYSPSYTGGVRLAVADVNGDNVQDIVTSTGPGGGPHVHVISGADFTDITNYFAYAADFRGGVWVASADLNGDGKAEIVTGADAGGGPHVRVVNGADFSDLYNFFAYSPSFTGGTRLAACNGKLVTVPGPSGGPHVQIRNGDGSAGAAFYAFETSMTQGMFVACR